MYQTFDARWSHYERVNVRTACGRELQCRLKRRTRAIVEWVNACRRHGEGNNQVNMYMHRQIVLSGSPRSRL